MENIKRKLICTVECPNCLANLNIIKETEIIEPARVAEKKEWFKAEKSVQTTLPLPGA